MQKHALAAEQFKVQIPDHIAATRITGTQISGKDKTFFRIDERLHMKFFCLLNVLQQALFFFDLPFHPLFILCDAALHFLRLGTDKGSCAYAAVMFFDRVKTDFRVFIFLRPTAASVCRAPQRCDLLQMFFVLRQRKLIFPPFIFPPRSEIAALYFDRAAV